MKQSNRDWWHALTKAEHDEIVNRTGRPITQPPRAKRTSSSQGIEANER